jgi:hypothetical protein
VQRTPALRWFFCFCALVNGVLGQALPITRLLK